LALFLVTADSVVVICFLMAGLLSIAP